MNIDNKFIFCMCLKDYKYNEDIFFKEAFYYLKKGLLSHNEEIALKSIINMTIIVNFYYEDAIRNKSEYFRKLKDGQNDNNYYQKLYNYHYGEDQHLEHLSFENNFNSAEFALHHFIDCKTTKDVLKEYNEFNVDSYTPIESGLVDAVYRHCSNLDTIKSLLMYHKPIDKNYRFLFFYNIKTTFNNLVFSLTFDRIGETQRAFFDKKGADFSLPRIVSLRDKIFSFIAGRRTLKHIKKNVNLFKL